MTEGEARAWIADRYGEAGCAAMERIVAIVFAETDNQNLVARSTLATIWNRHIVDSAQLLDFAGSDVDVDAGVWIDIGSGAGFPGLVVAALSQHRVLLVEPRVRRAHFLRQAVSALELEHRVTVVCSKIESMRNIEATVISARAVAPLTDLFAWSQHCYAPATQWVLPKGQTAREDVATARQTWHGTFHVEHSITDPYSLIVLASGVMRR